MNAVRQSCRPKHQVLILKCYPKYQKNAVDVKPNSSELSYLLYYASTRRSKLQKVGDFLEKRTTSDVWRARLGNVQVTLLILAALIEKTPRDLPLYSHAVLSIFRTILRSNNVEMVQASVPAFEVFCAHQDPATLAADQEYIQQYEEVLKLYAMFARRQAPIQINVPVAIRVRKAGLEALKAVATSDSLGAETGRQLSIIVPVVLQNLYAKRGSHLKFLEQQEHRRDELDKEAAYKRRQSTSTVRTAEADEPDPAAAEGTTEDADNLAEEEVGIVALQTLRQIFAVNSRGQHRLATSAVLNFVMGHVSPTELAPAGAVDAAGGGKGGVSGGGGSWHTTLFEMICGWAPVQDRFVILVTVMETLVRSPIVERDLDKQLTLVTIIRWLLGSSINVIGLSVMDVLVGLIQHVLLLLQLGGHGSGLAPHPQQADGLGKDRELDAASRSSSNTSAPSGREFKEAARQPAPAGSLTNGVVMEVARTPSSSRIRLLAQLQRCIGALATHVYYTDQISDMMSAILIRLKPPASSAVSSTADAIRNPTAAVDAVAYSANLLEKPNADGFFSFDTARLMALQSIKDILVTANAQASDGSSNVVGRTQVGISVWEGTQWLLRDPSGSVRKAYVDALVTWLNLEVRPADLKVWDDGPHSSKRDRRGTRDQKDAALARRAVSNASHHGRSSRHVKTTFFHLLHLAVYDNAHQHAESEPDVLLLHLLLATLVQKLGVNAARSGLPMILRLQEDIPAVASPTAKTHIGSLVHGYLWALSSSFNLDASAAGRAIHAEIARRTQHGIWLRSVHVPPLPPSQITAPPPTPPVAETLPAQVVQTESLRPFDARPALVAAIAAAYAAALNPPPTSPPASPGRRASSAQPILDGAARARGVSLSAAAAPAERVDLPQAVRDELLASWSRDAVVAAAAREGARPVSLASGAERRHPGAKGHPLGAASPQSERVDFAAPASPAGASSARAAAAAGRTRREASSSSAREALHVQDLKRVLASGGAGVGIGAGGAAAGRDTRNGDTASESMVSADELETSEVDFGAAAPALAQTQAQTPVQAQGAAGGGGGGGGGGTTGAQGASSRIPSVVDIEGLGVIPRPSTAPYAPGLAAALAPLAPLAPLPPPAPPHGAFPPPFSQPPPPAGAGAWGGPARPLSSPSSLRRGASAKVAARRGGGPAATEGFARARVDVRELLDAIAVDGDGVGEGGVGRPPY